MNPLRTRRHAPLVAGVGRGVQDSVCGRCPDARGRCARGCGRGCRRGRLCPGRCGDVIGYGRSVPYASPYVFSMLHLTNTIKTGIMGIPGDLGLNEHIINNNKTIPKAKSHRPHARMRPGVVRVALPTGRAPKINTARTRLSEVFVLSVDLCACVGGGVSFFLFLLPHCASPAPLLPLIDFLQLPTHAIPQGDVLRDLPAVRHQQCPL